MKFFKHISLIILLIFLVLQMSCTETSAQSRKKTTPKEIEQIDTLNLENKDNKKTERKLVKDTKSFKNYEDFEFNSKKKKKEDITDRYYQKGMASWYGRSFHGRETASGEKFNMYKYTAAHKTIPFGSIVEITNLKNGKKIRVKINDRGPYKGKRILDMSYGAARELNLLGSGTEMVGIKIIKRGGIIAKNNRIVDDSTKNNHSITPVVSNLEKDDKIIYKSDMSAGYTLQAGAFYSKINAMNFQRKLQSLVNGKVVIVKENEMFKVRIKGMVSKVSTKKIKEKLLYNDIKTFVVQEKE